MRSALSTVRTLKNTVIPAINRLPQDVLVLIPTYFDPEAPQNVLNASHVCRHWRSAFISSPVLWGTVDATNMATSLMQLYLDRSGASLLDAALKETTASRISQQFLDCSHRIRSLSFRMTSWDQALSQPLSLSALPALVNLSIRVDTGAALGPTMFSHAPNLRHLTIKIFGPSVPIRSHAGFPNLTTISIDCYMSPLAMVLGRLLDLLQSSPLLTDVDLTLTTSAVRPIVPHRRVPLPCLREFSLSCSPVLVIVLTLITFPPSANIVALVTVWNPPLTA